MNRNEGDARFVAARRTPEYLHDEAFVSYWRLLAWPVVVASLVTFFALRTMGTFTGWREWVIQGVTLLVLAVFALRRYDRERAPMLLIGALAGFLVGLGSATLHLIHDFAFYKLFTLLTYPSATALLGALLAWGTIWVSTKSATLPFVRLIPGRQAK